MLQRYTFLAVTLVGITACGRDPEIRADTAVRGTTSSATGEVGQDRTARRDTAARPDSARQSSARPDSAHPDSARASKDSTVRPAITVRVPEGRPKRDSLALVSAIRFGRNQAGWPVNGPAPATGAVLPNRRVIAFYGNPLSTRMGILGEIPPQQMLARLEEVAKQWQAADPSTPVQPALHFIAVVAQAGPGKDGKYRLRMDSSMIEQVYGWAQQKGALLFLDIQAGQSTIQEELPRLMKFLERPNVHLGIDPEFYMHYDKEGVVPGKKIGTLSSAEINYAIEQLSRLVAQKNIPPKILVVHRFTRPMVRGARQIKLDPRVQVVLHMDGWGAPWLKFDSYKDYVVNEPVQFTGFKLFYKNDTKKGDKLLTPMELLQLYPAPLYIQYQ